MADAHKTYRRGVYTVKEGKTFPCLVRAVSTLGIATIEICGSNHLDGEVIKEVKQDIYGRCSNSWRYEK